MIENHTFVKLDFAKFSCVISRKKFLRDSFFVYFSTLCVLEYFSSFHQFYGKIFSVIAFSCTFPHCAPKAFFRQIYVILRAALRFISSLKNFCCTRNHGVCQEEIRCRHTKFFRRINLY